MRLQVTVKPNSKKPGIDATDPSNWIVRVRAAAIEGKANRAVLEAVSEKLNIPVSHIKLVRGEKSKTKLLEIPDR